MRCWLLVCAIIVISICALAGDRRAPVPLPAQFEVARHTFFDFGPPFDYYEVFLVRPLASGTSIQRITLTPAGQACIQPAKIETATGSTPESVAALLGTTNPCAIPEKELRKERKRCKKCLVFSGAELAMRMQCGNEVRIIRADVLDRDMFDAAPNTPQHTSWTMRLLGRLDEVVGPGVMDKPVFQLGENYESNADASNLETLDDISSGKYDALFPATSDKPSALYRAAQNTPPPPIVRLLSSLPFRPETFVAPDYPALARLAHINGIVTVTLNVDGNGDSVDLRFESGHPILREAVKKAVSSWKFGKPAANQEVRASIEFDSNCTPKSIEK